MLNPVFFVRLAYLLLVSVVFGLGGGGGGVGVIGDETQFDADFVIDLLGDSGVI